MAARVFPLWVIIGVILLWGLTVLEIFIKIRLPEAFSTTAVIIGACLALAVLYGPTAPCTSICRLHNQCVTLSGFERHSQKPSPPMPPASPALHCSRDQQRMVPRAQRRTLAAYAVLRRPHPDQGPIHRPTCGGHCGGHPHLCSAGVPSVICCWLCRSNRNPEKPVAMICTATSACSSDCGCIE